MKISKKTLLFTITAMLISFLVLYMLSLAPTAQEALALEIYHIELEKNQLHLQAEDLRAEIEALGQTYRDLDKRSNSLNTDLYPF